MAGEWRRGGFDTTAFGVTHPPPATAFPQITHTNAPPGLSHCWRQPKGYERMLRIGNGILMLTYLAGAVSFAYYDLLIRANSDLGSLIIYSAAWPIHVWSGV